MRVWVHATGTAGATGAAGATGTGEVVSRTAARSPPPTRARGQDDGSYTTSLKISLLIISDSTLEREASCGPKLSNTRLRCEYWDMVIV